jgi:hypothetical protein
MPTPQRNHHALAEALRGRVLDGHGESSVANRRNAAAAAAGRTVGPGPYTLLAKQIGEAAYRVTDVQVADVVAAAGSQKAAFEIIAAAATGAGIMRWQRAIATLESGIKCD